jgi:DNA polymerase III epsilon subunit-like protein
VTTKLILIDLETTSFSPNTGEIIEIAAVLAQYNSLSGQLEVIDTFQSLINIQQKLQDLITRVTGIVDNDLETAPYRFVVQEKWYQWLKKHSLDSTNEMIYLCGHSIIDFDIKFLKSFNWFLPTNYQLIDTLYLTKIIYPQFNAVNLENLCHKLDLQNHILIDSYINNTKNSYPLAAHRALYDVLVTTSLLQEILDSLGSHKDLPNSIINLIQKYFLHLPIDYLSISNHTAHIKAETLAKNEENTNLKNNSQIEISEIGHINWQGEIIKPNLTNRINDEHYTFLMLSECLIKDIVTKQLAQVFLQLVFIQILKTEHPNWQYCFHGRGSDVFLAMLLLDCCEKYVDTVLQTQSDSYTVYPKKLYTPIFENLIWSISQLSESTLNLESIMNTVEIAIDILQNIENSTEINNKLENNDNKELIDKLTVFINSYDFLLLALQPFWVKAVYSYHPKIMKVQEREIYNKLQTFLECGADLINAIKIQIENADNIHDKDKNQILFFCFENLVSNLEKNLPQSADADITFYLSKNHLRLGIKKQNFNLLTNLENLLVENSKNNEILITTYLDDNNILACINAFNLTPIQQLILGHIPKKTNELNSETSTDFEILESDMLAKPQLGSFLHNQYTFSQEVNKPCLILCGNNMVLKQIQEYVIDNFNHDSYLILGESGSLTKILSKLSNGFVGLIILKQQESWIIRSLKKSNLGLASVVLYGDMYFPVNNYWNSDINWSFKNILRQSLINQIKSN